MAVMEKKVNKVFFIKETYFPSKIQNYVRNLWKEVKKFVLSTNSKIIFLEKYR